MSLFRKVTVEVGALSARLEALSASSAGALPSGDAAVAAHAECRALAAQLSSPALQQPMAKFRRNAQEQDPEKLLYGAKMRASVLALLESFELLGPRVAELEARLAPAAEVSAGERAAAAAESEAAASEAATAAAAA